MLRYPIASLKMAQFSIIKDLKIEQVRNPNLKFDCKAWQIRAYPFYPNLYRKKGAQKIYEIDQHSVVLALTFLNKEVVNTALLSLKMLHGKIENLYPFNFEI